MSETQTDARRRKLTWLWVGGGLVLAIAVVVVALQMSAQRAQDRRVDTLYCTLSGVSLNDRGPETGQLCSDLLGG